MALVGWFVVLCGNSGGWMRRQRFMGNRLSMVSKLGRSRLVFLVLMLGAASCGDPVPDSSSAPTPSIIASGVEPVAGVTVVASGGDLGSSNGVWVDLERCLLESPGMLRLEGRIETPDGFEPGPVGMVAFLTSPVSSQGDATVATWHLKADVAGSGEFSFAVQRWDPELVPNGGFFVIDPSADLIAACSLRAGSGPPTGSVALQLGELVDRVEPPGSVQHLGSGARLGDVTDPRLVYAYLSALQWQLPFEFIWSPDPDSGVVVRWVTDYRDSTEPCPRMELTVATDAGEAHVAQTHGCHPSSNDGYLGTAAIDTGQPVPGSEVFTWWDSEGETLAAMVEGDLVVSIRANSHNAIAQTAASLGEYTNAYVRELADNPFIDVDLDTVLAGVLTEEGLIERDRFAYRDAQMVIVVQDDAEPPTTVGYLIAELTSSGWYLEGSAGTRRPAWTSCVDGMGAGDSQGGFHFFAVRDQRWTLETNDGTEWQQPESINGVAFFPFGPEADLISHMLDTQIRAVTAAGNPVPGC